MLEKKGKQELIKELYTIYKKKRIQNISEMKQQEVEASWSPEGKHHSKPNIR